MIKNYYDKFRFNDWANKQIIKKLSQLRDNETANEMMGHIIASQDMWLERIKDTPNYSIFLWEPFSTQELKVLSKNSTKEWLRFVSKIDGRQLQDICSYKNSKRKEFTNTIEEILENVILHSSHHRGQINKIFTLSNVKPPVIDYLSWSRKFNSTEKE